jgi:O-antigen/teichoic acid export membrane protein
MYNLKKKYISCAKWNFIFHMGQYAFTFILSIVLSQMIDPAEFGLTGLDTIFIPE